VHTGKCTIRTYEKFPLVDHTPPCESVRVTSTVLCQFSYFCFKSATAPDLKSIPGSSNTCIASDKLFHMVSPLMTKLCFPVAASLAKLSAAHYSAVMRHPMRRCEIDVYTSHVAQCLHLATNAYATLSCPCEFTVQVFAFENHVGSFFCHCFFLLISHVN